jgi:RNA polymerase-binding transcription factor DksA
MLARPLRRRLWATRPRRTRCCRLSARWAGRSSPGPATAAPLTVEQGESVKSPNPLPRAASGNQRCSNPLAARLPALRATLEHERDFRQAQLAQLDPHESAMSAVVHPVDGHQEAESALRAVDALIAAGARRALDDIELALARMHAGRYGYCRTCGLGIPLAVLEAIPKTTLCLACQGQTERGERRSPGRSPHHSRSAGRVSDIRSDQAAAATISCR